MNTHIYIYIYIHVSIIYIPHPRLLGDPMLSLRAATSIAEVAPRGSEQLLRGAWLTLGSLPSEAAWAVRLATRSLEEREETGKTVENDGKVVENGGTDGKNNGEIWGK